MLLYFEIQQGTPRSIPPKPPSGGHRGYHRRIFRERRFDPLRLESNPSHLLGVRQNDGGQESQTGYPGGHIECQLHAEQTQGLL